MRNAARLTDSLFQSLVWLATLSPWVSKLRATIADVQTDAINALVTGRALVVAPRLSTIAGADQIVIDNSRLVDTGTHDDLLTAVSCMSSCGATT
ncbi:MAG TPA: hypothetical protein VJT72_24140 [Pseudonocardiaceae bacterium]|nr:hypothetical protein [Pseudonocardiaceae bacterium]